MTYVAGFSRPSLTAAFGTALTSLIPPKAGGIIKINELVYETAGTAHDLIFMKALGKSTLSASAAAGATTINVVAKDFDAGDAITANDLMCIELDSGAYQLLTVSSVATLALTVNALDEAAAAGNDVFFFGLPSNTGHHTLTTKASTINIHRAAPPAGIADSSYSFVSGNVRYKHNGIARPMLFYSANGSAAGILRTLCGTYYSR